MTSDRAYGQDMFANLLGYDRERDRECLKACFNSNYYSTLYKDVQKKKAVKPASFRFFFLLFFFQELRASWRRFFSGKKNLCSLRYLRLFFSVSLTIFCTFFFTFFWLETRHECEKIRERNHLEGRNRLVMKGEREIGKRSFDECDKISQPGL